LQQHEIAVKTKFSALASLMSERLQRLWAASEANCIGRGGLAIVSRATGLSVNTIKVGVKELTGEKVGKEKVRIRKQGAGRKKLTQKNSLLLGALKDVLESSTRGDPTTPLLWTCKSTSKLAEELTNEGHPVSPRKVAELLSEMRYSLQSNRKTLEGKSHPDRNAQFEYISSQAKLFLSNNQPIISIDTKKKEVIGAYKNNGSEWCPKGNPIRVNSHDFPDKKNGKVVPYGIYDVTQNEGWVSVGIDHDTAEFAVQSIKLWWMNMGLTRYSKAKELLITADCGGSNGYRVRLWKTQLQKLANKTNLTIKVCHFPPGTSKWNKIEHRMFCHITMNWRARPLTSREVVVNLIGDTTTKEGLKIRSKLDENKYKKGQKVSKSEFDKVNLVPDAFHGEWNYTIFPSATRE
jgi:Rhodopirellula transposase DDE domain